jgi:hypothetical protein
LNYVLGERRLRFDDGRRLAYLPKACCRQKADAAVEAPAPEQVAAQDAIQRRTNQSSSAAEAQ